MDEILLIFFGILDFFMILALVFKKNLKQEKSFRFCPCKAFENSFFMRILSFCVMGGFLYSATSLSFVGFSNFKLDALFILVLLCAFLILKIKK